MRRVSQFNRLGCRDALVLANVSTTGARPRSGLALLAAIVCLLVLSAISVGLVRTVLARVREADLHEHQLQADALAQSALARGIAQRAANPAYPGEVWTPEVSGVSRMKAEIQWIDAPTGGSLRVVCFVPADACAARSSGTDGLFSLTPSSQGGIAMSDSPLYSARPVRAIRQQAGSRSSSCWS